MVDKGVEEGVLVSGRLRRNTSVTRLKTSEGTRPPPRYRVTTGNSVFGRHPKTLLNRSERRNNEGRGKTHLTPSLPTLPSR